MEITLEVREDNIQFFMELIKKLDFVKVKYSSQNVDAKSPYNPEFVAKIRRSEKQVVEGNFKQMNPAELWD
jgi:hypothetical protein